MKNLVQATVVAVYFACAVTLGTHAAPAQNARKPGYSVLFAQLERTDAVVEGARTPNRVVYVFFDANCYYCHLTWKALQPYERVGLQVRWVPVAYQQESSAGRAAAIMEASDRVAALRDNELKYDVANYDGGIQPTSKLKESILSNLRANTQLMRNFGAPGTPALVWKDASGNVRFRAGVPRLSELPGMTGLPEQKVNDPELAQFR